MSQPPGEPPYGGPQHRPPADPFSTPHHPYQAPMPGPAPHYGPDHTSPTHSPGATLGYGTGQPPDVAQPYPSNPPPPPPAAPGYGAPMPPSPRRRGRGPLIAVVVSLAVIVAGLASVGAWLLLRDSDRDGAPDPITATEEFLVAVYGEFDPAAAAAVVCSQARDEAALTAKIDKLREAEQTYIEPRYTWSTPEVVEESGQTATVAVTVTMTTGDERLSNLALELTVLDKDPEGWWVCDVSSRPVEGPVPPVDAAADPSEEATEEDEG